MSDTVKVLTTDANKVLEQKIKELEERVSSADFLCDVKLDKPSATAGLIMRQIYLIVKDMVKTSIGETTENADEEEEDSDEESAEEKLKRVMKDLDELLSTKSPTEVLW